MCKWGLGGGPLGLIVPVTRHTAGPIHPPVFARHTGGHQRQQLWCIESSPGLLSDPEHLPDNGLGPVHPFVAARRVGPEPHSRERRFHHIRRSEMNPVFFRECVEGHHAIPVAQERVDGLGICLAVQADEGVALPLTLVLRRSIGHGLEHLGGLRLRLPRQRVEDVGELVVPAPLLLPGRMKLPKSGPDAEVSVGHRESWELQSAAFEIPKELEPTFFALPLAALAGEEDLLPRGERAHNREEGALAVRDARFHVEAIRPPVDHLQIRQIAGDPRLVLELEADLHPLNGARRQGGALTQESAQRQLKVACRQSVQVQLLGAACRLPGSAA